NNISLPNNASISYDPPCLPQNNVYDPLPSTSLAHPSINVYLLMTRVEDGQHREILIPLFNVNNLPPLVYYNSDLDNSTGNTYLEKDSAKPDLRECITNALAVKFPHHIDTGDTLPIKQYPYQYSPAKKKIIQDKIGHMILTGIIRPCQSLWTSPIVLVSKKDRSTQFCINYRKLNAITIKDNYPLPRIDDLLKALSGSSWYSSLNIASGYLQVKVDESNHLKTTFTTPFGTFQFNVMPFGL
ncbi:26584_t:CDS:2, partial [Racocetra persica]